MEHSRKSHRRLFAGSSSAAPRVAAFLFVFVVLAFPARGQDFQLIHVFSGAADGGYPLAGLTLDAAGNFYGTSASQFDQQNCPTGCLVVYELSPHGTGWNFATLFAGQNASQGSTPVGNMAFGPDGNLYGTTAYGGTAGCYPGWGCGVIFRLSPANGSWSESMVYQFAGIPNGNFPAGQLAFDSAGNLYGTTSGGGSTVGCLGGGCTGNGVVYKLALADGTESVLYTFGANRVNDGIGPAGGVVLDPAGNLYGTTVGGGNLNRGTVFKLTPNGSTWMETILHTFSGGDGGVWPRAGVILDAAGNLYGSTEYNYLYGGGGTAFELSTANGNWTNDVLYDFPSRHCATPPCHLDEGPVSNFIMDSAGNLYGTAVVDGSSGCGSVFKLGRNPGRNPGGWTYTSLHDFTCGIDGGSPSGGLVMDSAGNIYGTATGGGVVDAYCPSGCGVIFKITP